MHENIVKASLLKGKRQNQMCSERSTEENIQLWDFSF